MKLNIQDKYQERMFIITSIIRLMSMYTFSDEFILMMSVVSQELREIEADGGVMSDEALFKLFDKKMKKCCR